ncbi:hypothetical protein [Sphingobacterium sp. BIGb0165]|nr:hypothetical protein [Sphingobacterium sp. BIGb0165]MCS4224182.1 hypothetical protein [Sphingobacterium sp. BIGb0165]
MDKLQVQSYYEVNTLTPDRLPSSGEQYSSAFHEVALTALTNTRAIDTIS